MGSTLYTRECHVQQELMILFMTGAAFQICIVTMRFQTDAKNICWSVAIDINQRQKQHVLGSMIIKICL